MKHSKSVALVAVLAALAVFGVPGVASLAATTYALSPLHVWLVALYLVASALSSFALAGRLTANLAQPRGRPVAAAICFGLVWAITIALPFVALVLTFAVLGPFAAGSQWLLFNKYLGFIVESAFHGYSWLLWLALFVVASLLLTKTEWRMRPKASPA